VKAVSWTAEEQTAVKTTQPFLIKARVMTKIWQQAEVLRTALRNEVEGRIFTAPEGLDLTRGQIAKGERFQELPFVFLDFPQFFVPGKACTYRTFFWWGHGVFFALILEGEFVETYKKRIAKFYDTLAGKQLHLSLSETPWEWETGTGRSMQIMKTNRSQVLSELARRPFLKLFRVIRLESRAFRTNRWVDEGVRTFRLLRAIISP
jgi:hypothetical protein